MKIKIIIALALFVMLALTSILQSCGDSNTDKTANTDQGVTFKDSVENIVSVPSRPVSAIDTSSIENSTPEKEKMADNSLINQETKPSTNKTSTTNNDLRSSEINKANSKPTINETAETTKPPTLETNKTTTIVEPPKSDPVSPTKEVAEKEEPEIITPPEPEPEPEPILEEPEAPIVIKPAIKDTQPPKVEPKVPETAKDSWVVPAKHKNKINPYKDDVASLSTGKSLYKKHCTSCHGKKGLGDGSKAKQLDTPSGDFTLPSFQKQTDGSLFYKTREGRDDMPGFKKKIPDEEDVWLIVNYIRTLK